MSYHSMTFTRAHWERVHTMLGNTPEAWELQGALIDHQDKNPETLLTFSVSIPERETIRNAAERAGIYKELGIAKPKEQTNDTN